MNTRQSPEHGARLGSTGEFCWMDLKTHDLPGTATTLSTMLGWQFAVDPSDWRRATVITVGGYRIGTVSDLAAPIYSAGTPPHLAFYMAVDDADRRTAAAARHGAQVIVAPFDAADQGRIATLIDPFGAAVSLWQPAWGHGWQHPVGLLNAPYRMRLTSPQPDQAGRFYRDVLGAGLRHADILPSPHGTTMPGQWHLTISANLDNLGPRITRHHHEAGIPAATDDSGMLPVRTAEGITLYATAPLPPAGSQPVRRDIHAGTPA